MTKGLPIRQSSLSTQDESINEDNFNVVEEAATIYDNIVNGAGDICEASKEEKRKEDTEKKEETEKKNTKSKCKYFIRGKCVYIHNKVSLCRSLQSLPSVRTQKVQHEVSEQFKRM